MKLRSFLVPRRVDDHKGVFGHVLIVAGSRGMMGAAFLCARACLRSGAGLVTLALPKSFESMALSHIPEALTLGLPENKKGALSAAGFQLIQRAHQNRRFDVLAIGPGLSQDHDTGKLLASVLKKIDIPTVIDADALNLMAAAQDIFFRIMKNRNSLAIMTPHPGEMARLLKILTQEVSRNREGAAVRLARALKAIVVLKGHQSLISDGSRNVLNSTGGTGLSKGGTGDVLTGLLSGLWAQALASKRLKNVGAFEVAVLGAHLHGLAGDIAEKTLTPWAMTAQDVIACFPQAFQNLCKR
jgi:NAD(P)H-hydrate epimerase